MLTWCVRSVLRISVWKLLNCYAVFLLSFWLIKSHWQRFSNRGTLNKIPKIKFEIWYTIKCTIQGKKSDFFCCASMDFDLFASKIMIGHIKMKFIFHANYLIICQKRFHWNCSQVFFFAHFLHYNIIIIMVFKLCKYYLSYVDSNWATSLSLNLGLPIVCFKVWIFCEKC